MFQKHTFLRRNRFIDGRVGRGLNQLCQLYRNYDSNNENQPCFGHYPLLRVTLPMYASLAWYASLWVSYYAIGSLGTNDPGIRGRIRKTHVCTYDNEGYLEEEFIYR